MDVPDTEKEIDSSAKRMGDLIKSVLDYTRIPSHPDPIKLTDLNEIVENVKARQPFNRIWLPI